jgi:2-keto-4-pentenoate hydratase/2-oxohepta-3-ene-1,7-dioic acid hydratase in catechol pathway
MRVGRLSDGTRTVLAVHENERWFAVDPGVPSVLDLLSGTGLADGTAGQPLANGFRPTVPFRPARNVMCLGKNFRAHAEEFAAYSADPESVPAHPIVFTKAPEALCGAEDEIQVPREVGSALDYEAELGVVIGLDGAAIPVRDALDHVAGYTVLNDVTARDIQDRHRQWFLGKSLPRATPIGPVVVTPDELGDLARLRITCHVNDELRQAAVLGDMIFGVAETISIVSALVPLCRGDIISMGTPSGVGIGFTPPRFLEDGDEVVCEIEGVGRLRNVVRLVAAPVAAPGADTAGAH